MEKLGKAIKRTLIFLCRYKKVWHPRRPQLLLFLLSIYRCLGTFSAAKKLSETDTISYSLTRERICTIIFPEKVPAAPT